MKSMTGYGRALISENGRTVTAEIKSVNHRFLDVALKNFRALSFTEDGIKKLVEKKAARGHIEVFISYSDERSDAVSLEIDRELAEKYKNAARKLEAELGIRDDLTFGVLIRHPDVFKSVRLQDDEEILRELITRGVAIALDEMDSERLREGGFIKADLYLKLKTIEACTNEIAERSPRVFFEYREKLTQRMKEILNDTAYDEARLLNEVAFFTDRAGIDEEIERLKIHIASFFELLESSQPVGRKMDFTIQEINREINTVGSKSNDIELSNIVIKVKTELEKLREQCQNVE